MNFGEALEQFLSIEGRWKIDFIRSEKEKGYIVVENGQVKKAVLREGDIYHKGNIALEKFIQYADEYFIANYMPESEDDSLFEVKEEQVTLTTDFILSLLKRTLEAKKQVEKIKETTEKLKNKVVQTKEEPIQKEHNQEIEIPFNLPPEHVLVYVRNGRVKINKTNIPDEEYEGIVREFTTKTIDMGKGEGEAYLRGKEGGYYFRYRPGEAIFMLLTKEGIGDLLLSLEE